MASPLEISIGLWYACRHGDYGKDTGDNNFSAASVQQALADFVAADLLNRSPPGCVAEYYATDGLRCWVNALTAVPFPVKQWTIPVSGDDND